MSYFRCSEIREKKYCILESLEDDKISKIKQIRKTVEKWDDFNEHKEYLTDLTFYRYLLHTYWKCDSTLEIIRKVINWRKDYISKEIDLNSIREQLIKKNLQNWKLITVHGIDKKGHPIIYLKMKEESKVENDEEGLELKFKLMCVLQEDLFFNRPKGTHNSSIILDADGVGFSFIGAARALGKKFSKFNIFYSETLDSIFVVNAGFVVSALYKIVSIFLYEETKEKIKVCRNTSILKELVDEDQLLSDYNGKVDFKCTILDYINFLIKEKESGKTIPPKKTIPKKEKKSKENKEVFMDENNEAFLYL